MANRRSNNIEKDLLLKIQKLETEVIYLNRIMEVILFMISKKEIESILEKGYEYVMVDEPPARSKHDRRSNKG